jgi:hypothetical protein
VSGLPPSRERSFAARGLRTVVALLTLAGAGLLPACALDPGDKHKCTTNADCLVGRFCTDGTCSSAAALLDGSAGGEGGASLDAAGEPTPSADEDASDAVGPGDVMPAEDAPADGPGEAEHPVADAMTPDQTTGCGAVDPQPDGGTRPNGGLCCSDRECSSGRCTDGRCCAESCSTCQSCTGDLGTCRAIHDREEDQDPPGACGGNRVCNGKGDCKLRDGERCGDDGWDCLGSVCIDGVCCRRGGCKPCESCAVPGREGLCTLVTAGEAPTTCGGRCQGGLCVVETELWTTPKRWDFGAVTAGHFLEKTVSVYAKTATALAFQWQGDDLDSFSVTDSTCGAFQAAPDSLCVLAIVFTPRSVGAKLATVIIVGEHGSVAIPMTGVGK